MAEYFNLTNYQNNVMVQNDDSRNKKVIYNFQLAFSNNLETNINNQDTDEVGFISAALNTEWFTLRQVIIREQIYFSGNIGAGGAVVTFHFGRHPCITFLPAMSERLSIGFSDDNIVASAGYHEQNNMILPIAHNTIGSINDYSIKFNEVFHLKKNKNYINVHTHLTMLTTGDVTVFWDLLRAALGTGAGDEMTIHYLYTVMVYGVLDTDYRKKIKKNI
jgi:hypothetical protein